MGNGKKELLLKLASKIFTDAVTTGVNPNTELILNTEMLLAHSPGFKADLQALVKKHTGTIKKPLKPRK